MFAPAHHILLCLLRGILYQCLITIDLNLSGIGREFLLPVAALENIAETTPNKRNSQRIQLLDEVDQLRVSIFAEVLMNHDDTRFTEQKIECEIFNALTWIASRINRKIVVDHC